MAGKVAATGIVSLPILASMSKRAKAGFWLVPGPSGPSGGDPSCFLRGTRIQTADGEIPVENLTIGTLVETLNGPLPVKWIGRQSFTKDSLSWHWSVAPIRIARFALADEYPRRDLYVSPRHGLFIDGYLMTAELLVNGKSITLSMNSCDRIDYFHIQLESHEVIFADGAPAETYLVANDRERFTNFVEYERLYGGDAPAMKPFAPLLEYNGSGDELTRLARLAVSPVTDLRDPVQKARARIKARAEALELTT
jgi:Hint domain